MPAVDLSANEWGQVMGILSSAPWRDANPLLMKIGQQLQQQAMPPIERVNKLPEELMPRDFSGNSREAPHE